MNLPDSIFYFSYIPQHTQLFAFNFTNIFKSVSHAIFFLPPENFLIHFLTHIHFSFYLANYYFSCVDHNKLWKILQDVGIPDHLTCLLRNLYAGQEATVRTGHGKQTGSKSGKEYNKAVYCHLAYLIYIQSTSCEMSD